MSYGSAYIQTEAVSKINTRPSRSKRDYVKRIVQYDKEFDVSLSRIDTREKSFKDSMVAYSEKMRSIADARNNLNNGSSRNDPLFVRAKHIPKYPIRQPRKRRPMSLDELIGRDRALKKDKQNGLKARPLSDKAVPSSNVILESRKQTEELHLPILSDRLKKSSPNVQVSLVSASDLYDIVDFSLRTRGSRQDSINFYEMERKTFSHSSKRNDHVIDRFIAEAVYDKYERCQRKNDNTYSKNFETNTKVRPPFSKSDPNDIHVPTAEDWDDEQSENDVEKEMKPTVDTKTFKLPMLRLDPLKYRPNRVKRMKLQNSGLGAIPEDNIVSHNTYVHEEPPVRLTPISLSPPPPPTMSPRNLAMKSNLDSIQEDESSREENKNEFRSIVPQVQETKSTRRILMRDDGDVRIEVTQCPPKQEPLNAKLRAQKKFKKLIFLRDMK